MSDYLTETEALLALLSHCLRTIQEAEIVSRGYSRYIHQLCESLQKFTEGVEDVGCYFGNFTLIACAKADHYCT